MQQTLHITIAGQLAPGHTGPEWPTAEERIAIDPKKVPDEEYQVACRVLASSIRLALSTPEGRASYEAWKREREITP